MAASGVYRITFQAEARPRAALVKAGGSERIELQWTASAAATDVEFWLEGSEAVGGPWVAVAAQASSGRAGDRPGWVTWVLRDARDVVQAKSSCYRLGIRLKIGA